MNECLVFPGTKICRSTISRYNQCGTQNNQPNRRHYSLFSHFCSGISIIPTIPGSKRSFVAPAIPANIIPLSPSSGKVFILVKLCDGNLYIYIYMV